MTTKEIARPTAFDRQAVLCSMAEWVELREYALEGESQLASLRAEVENLRSQLRVKDQEATAAGAFIHGLGYEGLLSEQLGRVVNSELVNSKTRAEAAEAKLADRTAELQRSQFRSNEFQARMQLAQAPPSTEAWQKLVHLAGIEGSGADFIYQITHSYNEMQKERDTSKAKLSKLLGKLNPERLEEMATEFGEIGWPKELEYATELRAFAAAVKEMGK